MSTWQTICILQMGNPRPSKEGVHTEVHTAGEWIFASYISFDSRKRIELEDFLLLIYSDYHYIQLC